MYVFVPNTRVRLKPALIGGVFAGVLWAGGGSLFTSFVVSMSRYEAIYAGFAIVLVAMVWLYLSWLILLLGAQLAFYVQNPEYLPLGQRTLSASNATRERLALVDDAARRPRLRETGPRLARRESRLAATRAAPPRSSPS